MGIPWVKKIRSFYTPGRRRWREKFPAAEGGRQIFWVVPREFVPQMIFFACPCMSGIRGIQLTEFHPYLNQYNWVLQVHIFSVFFYSLVLPWGTFSWTFCSSGTSIILIGLTLIFGIFSTRRLRCN